MLYDLAKSKEENLQLAKEITKLNDKLKRQEYHNQELQQSVDELSYIREINNQELLKCEKKVKNFSIIFWREKYFTLFFQIADSNKKIEHLSRELSDFKQDKELTVKFMREEVEKVKK